MNLGLNEADFNFLIQEVINPLKASNLKIFCFGSRARGDFQKFSDIDLMIENIVDKNQESLVSKIQENIGNSNFPYKVDLVDLRFFANSYLKNYSQEKIEL